MNKNERYNRYKYLTGLSAWEIASYRDPENVIILNDGPSGLRKPLKNGFTEQNEVIQTVCMPTPSALAASFDKDACYETGELIAKECLHHKTNILLAPGINIKRYVMCGRNFEYFSEDPYLTGILAANYVNGLEDMGVGACVKHYACNSQEHGRTVNSSEVSLRALNEIYLRGFKYTLKYSNPSSIMTSYNRINGVYVNESEYLLQKKLRKEFNFRGLIMSDWCAVSDKGVTYRTGLNIEMPLAKMSYDFMDRGYGKTFDDEDLIKLDNEIYQTISKFKDTKPLDELDLDKLHAQAVSVADKTIVLVKNDNDYLPIAKDSKILVLGYFANHARFVGKGSGWVNAYRDTTFLDVLNENGVQYDFVECYDEEKANVTLEELQKYQGKYDKVLLFLGQYQHDESEGIDRSTIDLRPQQIEVLNMVKDVFGTFATVLVSGSVVNVEKVYEASNSMFITYLAGEGQSEAIYNNLFGANNPSGRLPETWISSLKQNPINDEYARRDIYHTYYHDDIYVGYRYYDLHENGFILPFGYGLSYSKFNYSNFKYDVANEKIIVSLDVTNEGDIDGEDVIQIYIGKKNSDIYRPIKELKAFGKVFVKANTTEKVIIEVDIDDIKSYCDATDSFELEGGEYEVYVALNTNLIINEAKIHLEGVKFEQKLAPDVLIEKEVPSKYTLDTPAGILFENDLFKQYVKDNNLPIDVEDFERKLFWIDSKALRVTICDGDINITYEQMEDLVNFLNKHSEINRSINFDDIVVKYRPW
ncbi:MAG: glycoside hydrolase family 3 C-terminal domain-containing protein [Clostridia bacterium]|nr:glycoside hydrolase family 3 C-terminal domain-containing protein [Clostridia bacterium]